MHTNAALAAKGLAHLLCGGPARLPTPRGCLLELGCGNLRSHGPGLGRHGKKEYTQCSGEPWSAWHSPARAFELLLEHRRQFSGASASPASSNDIKTLRRVAPATDG
jgi:hypothetical protein